MSKPRHYVCQGCQGTIKIPRGRRNLPLGVVQATHEQTCPQQARRKP